MALRFPTDLPQKDGIWQGAKDTSLLLQESLFFLELRWDHFGGSSAPVTHIHPSVGGWRGCSSRSNWGRSGSRQSRAKGGETSFGGSGWRRGARSVWMVRGWGESVAGDALVFMCGDLGRWKPLSAHGENCLVIARASLGAGRGRYLHRCKLYP